MTRLLALALVVLASCTKDEPSFGDNDRTIARLKAEQERLAKGGQPGSPPKAAPRVAPEPNPLAEIAAANRPPVPIKALESTGVFGDVSITVNAAELSQTVQGDKVALSTEDRFLRVAFTAVAQTETTLDLSTVKLVNGEQEAHIARDVQRVGKGSPLSPITLEAKKPQELVIYFEGPASLLKGGLSVVFSSQTANLSLQLQ
jgi:hypothetical protein